MKDALGWFPDQVYPAFMFEAMRSRHLGISKQLKSCFACNVGSRVFCTEEQDSCTVSRTFMSLKGGTLYACISLFIFIENEFLVIELCVVRVDFQKGELSS